VQTPPAWFKKREKEENANTGSANTLVMLAVSLLPAEFFLFFS
jgi:hypothetical protein